MLTTRSGTELILDADVTRLIADKELRRVKQFAENVVQQCSVLLGVNEDGERVISEQRELNRSMTTLMNQAQYVTDGCRVVSDLYYLSFDNQFVRRDDAQ